MRDNRCLTPPLTPETEALTETTGELEIVCMEGDAALCEFQLMRIGD